MMVPNCHVNNELSIKSNIVKNVKRSFPGKLPWDPRWVTPHWVIDTCKGLPYMGCCFEQCSVELKWCSASCTMQTANLRFARLREIGSFGLCPLFAESPS